MKLAHKLSEIAALASIATIPFLSIAMMPVLGAGEGTNSFEPYNYPRFYVRHQNALGEVTKISSELDRKDATFRGVQGLAGECRSFESVNYPGYYLRHQNGRIKLHQTENSDLFQKDATFCIREGLANSADRSFESYNYPGFYIRHKNGHLFIDKGSGDLFNKDATFRFRSPLWWAGYRPTRID